MAHRTSATAAVLATSLALLSAAGVSPGAAATALAPVQQIGAATAVTLTSQDVSAPLSELATRVLPRLAGGNREIPIRTPLNLAARHVATPDRDAVVQRLLGPVPLVGKVISFDGTSDDDNASVVGTRTVPPDTEGDVGLDHYVQWNNLVMEIFDKSTGASVLGPIAGNAVFAGMGGICETTNNGDPIVLYDHLADRWMISQFAIGADGHQCIAVSTTPDPTGSYFRYDFLVTAGGLNDYPKFGLWHDGYYMTINEFAGGVSFAGAAVVAFERDAMLVGAAATGVKWVLPCLTECPFSLQPADLDGPITAAGNAPETIVMAFDDETWGTGTHPDSYRLWAARPDYGNPPASTLTTLPPVVAPEFDSNLCNFLACITQPAPGELLAALSQFTMYRAQIRDFGTHQTLVVSHTVDASPNNTDIAGMRWAELRYTAGVGWTLFQTGTVAKGDGNHRWMGSAAMNGNGDIALGYAVSGAIAPSIRMTSRMSADPLGTMGPEMNLHSGSGVQTGSFNRWGDYSTMSVDPSDDCTFWYTQEYYSVTGSFDFNTRVIAFQLPGCGP